MDPKWQEIPTIIVSDHSTGIVAPQTLSTPPLLSYGAKNPVHTNKPGPNIQKKKILTKLDLLTKTHIASSSI